MNSIKTTAPSSKNVMLLRNLKSNEANYGHQLPVIKHDEANGIVCQEPEVEINHKCDPETTSRDEIFDESENHRLEMHKIVDHLFSKLDEQISQLKNLLTAQQEIFPPGAFSSLK